MPSNATRAAIARQALLVNTGNEQEVQADPRSAIVDILTNLMHFCHARQKPTLAFNDCLRTARGHFHSESRLSEDEINKGGFGFDEETPYDRPGQVPKKSKRAKPLKLAKLDDLYAHENYPFWRQQVEAWATHLMAGHCSLEELGIEEDDLRGCFKDKDTPHDFVERMIQKHDLIRPDPIEQRSKPAPECPYHKDSQL